MTNMNSNNILIQKKHSSEPLKNGNPHYIHNNNAHELYLFLKGDVSFNIDGHIYKLEPLDLLIINNKEVHRTIIHSNVPYERIFIYIDPITLSKLNFEKYDLMGIFENRKPGYGNKINHQIVIENSLAKYFEDIYEWSNSDLPEKYPMMFSILIQLIVKIGSISPSNIEEERIKEAASYNGKIYLILNYISANLHRKITLDELEKKFFINKYYLCHLFKQVTGFTFTEYISHKKVSLAKELLQNGIAINIVWTSLGFEDYSSFFRTFKKIANDSPQQYIEKHAKM